MLASSRAMPMLTVAMFRWIAPLGRRPARPESSHTWRTAASSASMVMTTSASSTSCGCAAISGEERVRL
jgi:hypothetical protein